MFSLTSTITKFILITAILGAIAYGIDANGYHRAESKYKLQIANADKARADEVARAKGDADKRRIVDEDNTLLLSQQLIDAKSTIDALTKRLQERAPNVSNFYRSQPDAALQPVPGWIVTHGWVCDYNRAIGYDVSGTGTAVSGTESASCASDPFSASTITAERILQHHEEYGGYCRKLEEQLNAVLDHVEFIERGQSK